jgi:hypothetical protein
MTDANLIGTDLSRANLTMADMIRTNLTGANLRDATMTREALIDANLDLIKSDLFRVLTQAGPEIPALRRALTEGQVDGSVYEGDCSCLVGTIAKAKGCDYRDLPHDSASPAERFFTAISPGDTPDTNPVSRIVLAWIDEFQG